MVSLKVSYLHKDTELLAELVTDRGVEPAMTPDLNLIEYVQDQLKQRLDEETPK